MLTVLLILASDYLFFHLQAFHFRSDDVYAAVEKLGHCFPFPLSIQGSTGLKTGHYLHFYLLFR